MPVLHWLGKEAAVTAQETIPFRLLDPLETVGETPHENLLIHGDNLEALKALLPYYAGKVKCVFIDPPYNTKSAFTHYDDNLEHAQWLSTLIPRLQVLRDLLAVDGSIWVTIDDNEAHYLKVLMDDLFGRKNFVANVIWQKRTSPDARLQISDAHEHIIVYSKSKENISFNKLALNEKQLKNYKNPDNDPRGAWASSDYSAQGFRPNQMYVIKTPAGVEYTPPSGNCWKNVESAFLKQVEDNRIWFGKDGKGVPRRKTFLSEREGISAWTWWDNIEVGHSQEAKKEINVLFGTDNTFDTPKPERLIQRVLHLATNEGDIVLDSFLGSATTAAVALKMKRRFIGIELGNHAHTHCLPRLKKVVAGEQGGISKTVGWQGGGGFTFYTLAEPLIEPDGGIHPKVRFNHLASRLWYQESKTHAPQCTWHTPLVGITPEGMALFLLYNGILADSRWDGGNVLQEALWKETLLPLLPEGFAGKVTVYGTHCQCTEDLLKQHQITFKHTPYDVEGI